MEQINQSIAQFLLHIGIDKENINWSLQILLIICIALLSYITTKLFRYIIIPAVQKSPPGPKPGGTITCSTRR